MMKADISSMSKEQHDAIYFDKGVAELIAGPGSGKTFVLTNRIKTLISEYGVRPEAILVITFTRASAIEMQDRFYKLMDNEHPLVTFGTFHSVFFQMLRTCPEMKKSVLISESGKYKIIADMLKQNGEYTSADDSDQLSLIAGLFGKIKNDTSDDDSDKMEVYASNMGISIRSDKLRKVYDSYNSFMSETGRLDFDDMILKCRNRLTSDDLFRDRWQKKFEYILIDEFQDICSLQYQVVKILAAPHDNLFVVGDDDQSIYGFRGARPGIMTDLVNDYPSSVRMSLCTNYRSSETIVKTADNIISSNKDRIDKNINAYNKGGRPVSFISCKSREDELCRIKDLITKYDPEHVAILCRKNRECRETAKFLLSEHVAFRIKDKLSDPLKDETVKDMMNYLSFIYLKRDRKTFLQIMNRPVRYLRRESVRTEIVDPEDMIDYYSDNQEMKERIIRLFRDIDRMKDMKPFLAVNFIRKVEGYDKWFLENHTSDQNSEYLRKAEDLQKCARQYGSFESICDHYRRLKEEFEKNSRMNDANADNGVRIMTYHGSKGLEFDTVILPFVNEGEIPPKQSNTTDAVEEERRMFYVASTRAKTDLTVLYVHDQQEKPSRFISKLLNGNGLR